MAREYAVALIDAKVDIDFSNGDVRQTIQRGQRVLTSEAVVRKFPMLFAPPDTWRDAPAPPAHPNVWPL